MVRKSATFDTKAAAQAWAVSVEADILSGRSGYRFASRNKVTVANAIDAYMRERAIHKGGARWEILRCRRFIEELDFAGMLIEDVMPNHVATWRDQRLEDGVATSTVNREMTLLSAIFQWAKAEKNWIAVNPAHGVRRPKDPPHRQRLIDEEEIAALLAALGYTYGEKPRRASHYVALAFLFAIETGVRAGEALKLKYEFVDTEKRVARITGGTKNGDLWRDIPLSGKALEILELCRNGNEYCFPVASGTLDALFRRAREKAGIEDLHFHDSRHQAATNLSRKISVLQLARVLGHRDIKNVMIYYNEDAADIAKRL
jgi:integrase